MNKIQDHHVVKNDFKESSQKSAAFFVFWVLGVPGGRVFVFFAAKEGVEAKYDFFLGRDTARNRLLPGFRRRVNFVGKGKGWDENPNGFSYGCFPFANKTGRHNLGGGFHFCLIFPLLRLGEMI